MERMLDIEITRRCNLRCDYCFVGWSRDWTTDLPREVAEQVIREGAGRFDVLHITGGEPFARRDVFELIELALELGYPSILINSNGTMLSDDQIRRLGAFKRRVALSISLDGPKSHHDSIRGEGRFEQSDRTIEKLLLADVPVTVMTVVTRPVLEELPRFLVERTLRHPKLEGITLFPVGVGPTGTQKPSTELASLSPEELKVLASCTALARRAGVRVKVGAYPVINPILLTLGYPEHELYQCTAGRGRICVHADQSVSSCHPVKEPIYGSWSTGLFERIDSNELHQKLANREFDGCSSCDHRESCGHCRAFVTANQAPFLGNDRVCHEVVPGRASRPMPAPHTAYGETSQKATSNLVPVASLTSRRSTRNEKIIDRFWEIFFSGADTQLVDVVSDDCVDRNPIPLQPPGRDGIVFKMAYWRAERPQARSELLSVVSARNGAQAEWITFEGPGLPTTRWRGHFEIQHGKIKSYHVEHLG